MKKTLAIIATLALMVFGSSFIAVAAGDGGDGLPDAYIPFTIDQG